MQVEGERIALSGNRSHEKRGEQAMVQAQKQKEQTTSEATCHAEAKWSAVVNDEPYPMPRQSIPLKFLRSQANVDEHLAVLRDHNSPNDPVLDDDQEVNLADGNVFRLVPRCEIKNSGPCQAPPKLAFFMDDRWEITTNPNQSGEDLRLLFALDADYEILRDLESPNDVSIKSDEKISFGEGPVFVSQCSKITIIVNGRQRKIEKRQLSFQEIVELAFPNPPQGSNICFTVTYRDCTGAKGRLVEGDTLNITKGLVIDVAAPDKS